MSNNVENISRVLIAGCGYVGSALADQLQSAGHCVYGLKRNPANFPRGVFPLALDLMQPQALEHLPADLDAVVYAVAASAHDEAGYRQAYVEGPANLIKALRSSSPNLSRLIFVSSTSVYGQDDGSWVDETSVTEPSNFSGSIMLEGESTVLDSEFSSAVVRFSGIYGPGRARQIELVQSGRAQLSPNDSSYSNRIHRDDCAGILRQLMFSETVESIYLGTDSEPTQKNQVYQWLAQQLGVQLETLAGDSPQVSSRFSTNKRCSNARIISAGYSFLYPSFREGYRELIST